METDLNEQSIHDFSSNGSKICASQTDTMKNLLNTALEDRWQPHLYLKIQSALRSEHSVSVTKTSQLMYREIIAVYS